MAYAAFSVVFGEQPSAAKWNILGTNDSSFNDGTGIGSNTITNAKLALTGSSTATVATTETSTSTSFTDLTTPGPAVTVTIGSSGRALVELFSSLGNNTLDIATLMGFAVSGASTVAAADTYAMNLRGPANLTQNLACMFYVAGLSAGSNTFTAKYRTVSNTGTWAARRISVVPI